MPIKGVHGRTLYILSVDSGANYAKGDYVEGLELSLHRPHQSAVAQNLLAPVARWHGAQPFLFDAHDLKDGSGSSMYGTDRTIPVDSLGLVVKIKIVRADVSRNPDFPPDGYQLNALELRVDVENAPAK